jgi:hypothetical protein
MVALRRIGAVRNDEDGALLGPLRHQRQRIEDGVVDRGAARGLDPGQGPLHVFFGLGPPGERPRPMVEREDEELVGRIEQIGEETIDGGARVLDALAEHAVADVEQQAEADRDAFIGELRDGLGLAVFEDLERFARKSRDQVAFGVGDGGGDADELDARLEGTRVLNRLLPGGIDRPAAAERHRDREGGGERQAARTHGDILPHVAYSPLADDDRPFADAPGGDQAARDIGIVCRERLDFRCRLGAEHEQRPAVGLERAGQHQASLTIGRVNQPEVLGPVGQPPLDEVADRVVEQREVRHGLRILERAGFSRA